MAAKRKYLDIDELFRSKLEDFPAEPGEAVKAELMRKVSAKEFVRFNPARFNVYYLAAAVVSVSVAIIIALGNPSFDIKPEESVNITDTISDKLTSDRDSSIVEIDDVTGKIIKEESAGSAAMGTSSIKSATGKEDQRKKGASGTGETGIELKGKQPAREISIAAVDDKVLPEGSPVSSFTITELSGCVPLTVRLKSTSRNYDALLWTGSDGRSSADKENDWVLTKPGVFTIILKVTGKDGRVHSSSATVTVYAAPIARFDISMAGRGVSDREIMIYNYSEGGLTYRWDFGDGESSPIREPIHIYRSSGRYRIILTVTNEHGCIDTISKQYSTSTGDYRIEFPNAFIPNKNGPTGGYYSLRSDEAAYVFHPDYEGVSDYRLLIYSRIGILLFESRDLNIGWDGYYKGQLCEPGVYVWRARGRYANGEQFTKSGDLTLLKF